MIRKALDSLYISSGAIASLLIAGICLLVCTQVLSNLITRFGGLSINLTIPSYADFAGYMLAAASFLALAYTLTQGGHIRVNLLLTRLPTRAKWISEIFSFCACAFVSGYVTFYMGRLCLESYKFGDLSPGIVAIPIWIPQCFVLVGMIIFTVALIDCLQRTIISGTSVFDAIELRKEAAE